MRVLPAAPSIEGLTAVVTGGSRGLGLLLARELLRHGCDVVLLARDDAELARAVGRLAQWRGGTVRGVVCDVRDRAAVQDRLAEIARDRDGLDIVIANAGIIQVGPADALGPDGFQEAMDSVFNGALNTALAALPTSGAARPAAGWCSSGPSGDCSRCRICCRTPAPSRRWPHWPRGCARRRARTASA